jgi:predicted metal-dependent peptidase
VKTKLDETLQNAILAVEKARYWLFDNKTSPTVVFYGRLAANLADVFDAANNPTACTDGERIRWNPDFVASLNAPQQRYTLLHETVHCAHMHFFRCPVNEILQIAGDYEVEETLRGIPGIEPPDGILICPDELLGLSLEEKYRAVRNNPAEHKRPDDKPGIGEMSKPGENAAQSSQQGTPDSQANQPATGNQQGTQGNQPENQPAQGGATAQDIQDKWERDIIQATIVSKALGQGDGPASMDATLAKIRAQRVDWKAETADFTKSLVSSRNDWSRRSRRHSWQQVMYPRKRVDDLGFVVFVRDTSGSIDYYSPAGTGSQFTALITDCIAATNVNAIVLDAGDAIEGEYRLEPGMECPLDARVGGGTDFRPAFERIEEIAESEGITIAGLIYLTDLDGTFPDDAPSYPVLWLSTNDRKEQAPFGRTIDIDDAPSD